jgi:protein-S-isoprenylcysteine O-methyltransferase Ste14
MPALGPRGEGWVVLQGVLFGAIVAAGWLGPAWPSAWQPWLRVASVISGALGALLVVDGVRHLGGSLTPFPKPAEGSSLREGGVYRLVRHPIYGGVLLLSLAWTLWSSAVALVPSLLLAALFEGKRHREEAWLVGRYPGYEGYRRRVRCRFIPFLW